MAQLNMNSVIVLQQFQTVAVKISIRVISFISYHCYLVVNSLMLLPQATLASACLLYLTEAIVSFCLKQIHHKQFAKAKCCLDQPNTS